MLTVKNTFKLFDVLNKHFKDDSDSRICISEIEGIMDNKVDLKMDDFATRKDLAELRMELKGDIAGLRTELKQDISDLRGELRQDINELRTEFQVLKADINLSLGNSALALEKSQKEQLRWIIGAMAAIFSLLFSILMTILKIF